MTPRPAQGNLKAKFTLPGPWARWTETAVRMTDIQRCEVRPGRLVEWTLHPDSVTAATVLPDDARPPAYVQEAHVRTARTVREDGIFVPTWLGAAFDVPGTVDLDALQAALQAWTLRHETLRSGFRWAGDEMRRFTLDPDAVALQRRQAGDFPDAGALVTHLEGRFDVVADALTWPNFMYAAVVRDDSTSVYLAFDHSNVDAASIHRIPAEIHELYAAAVAGRGTDTAPVASYVDFSATERAEADQVDDEHEVVNLWRGFIERCDGKLPNLPVDLGLDPAGPLPTQSLLHQFIADDTEASAFEALCRPYGGPLVGVLAASALVTHEMSGHDTYRAVVPFHTRVRSQWSQSVGWYVGGAPIEVPVDGAMTLTDAMSSVRAELRHSRPLSRIPIARVLGLLGSTFRPTSPDLYSIVSYVDARTVPGSREWLGLRAYGLVRVSYGDQVCVWVTRLHEGLQIAARYPDTDVAAKNVRLYVQRLREVVTSVAAGAPSPPGF